MRMLLWQYRALAVAILINEPSWNLVYHLNTPDRLLQRHEPDDVRSRPCGERIPRTAAAPMYR